MTVYLLHIEPAYAHARHYIGWTPDADPARRLAEHMSCGAAASPLIRAALAAGCTVTLAHVFAGAGRDFERCLKKRHDTCKWCPTCGRGDRRLPSPNRMTAAFVAARPTYGGGDSCV